MRPMFRKPEGPFVSTFKLSSKEPHLKLWPFVVQLYVKPSVQPTALTLHESLTFIGMISARLIFGI